MSWAADVLTFNEKTKRTEMEYEIENSLNHMRGYMKPVHLPLKLLYDVPVQLDYESAESMLSALYTEYGRKCNYGIRYYENEDIKETKKLQILRVRISDVENKIKEYSGKHSVMAFKAEYIGCPGCGSKLKKNLLKTEVCPLCKTDMRSATTKDTLCKYNEKLKDLKKQAKEEEKKLKQKKQKSADVMWIIHAEAYIG